MLVLRAAGRGDPDAWLDAAIAATAVGILAWEFVIVPAAAPAGTDIPALVAGVTDVLVLLIVARLFVQRVGPPSYLALLALVGLMVAAYASHYLQAATWPMFDRLLTGIWVIGFSAWGALALHPATRDLGRATRPRRETPRRSIGFLVMLAVVLAAPSAAFARAIQDDQRTSLGALLAGTAVLAALIFSRAARILRHLEADVAQRRAAELAATESSERLAMYQALVPVGVFAADRSGRLVYHNERLELLTGLGPGLGPTGDWLAAVDPEDGPRVAAARTAGFREGRAWSAEVRFVLPDASTRWVAVRAEPFAGQGSGGPGWIGSVADITPQVIARLAAEEREGFLNALIDQSPVGIQIYAPDGTSVAFNPTMQRMFGAMDLSTGIGTFNIMTHPFAVVNGLAERARPAFGGSAVDFGPIPMRFDDPGQPWQIDQPDLYVWVVLYPVKGPTGEITRVIGFYEDGTPEVEAAAAEQRLQVQLRETQKLEALGVLAGGIAHDFNNLLVAILGNIGIARSEIAPGAPIAADLAHAEAAAERAADLARQMLAYSGRGAFVTSTVRLDRIVGEMVELLERSISKDATLELELDDGAWVDGDVTQIRQVLLNLIVNASDALDGHGTIRISTGIGKPPAGDPHVVAGSEIPDGPCARIAVTDTGVGMDPATAARAFEPFFTTKSAGRGLGLATTLGIIRGQHGALRVRSAPGRGSTFEVFLPLATPPEHATPSGGPPAHAGDGDGAAPSGMPPVVEASAGEASGVLAARVERLVLLVDDEDGVRRLGRRVLERAGYRVDESGDGADAVATFARVPDAYAAVVLDMTLPTMDGLTVLARMRETRPDIPIVLSSGWSGDEIADGVLRQAHTRFLQKPYRPEDLLESIDAAVGGGSPIRS